MANEKTNVLKENEIEANKVTVTAMFISCVALILCWVFLENEFFFEDYGFSRAVMIIAVASLLIAAGVGIHVKFNKPWLQYWLMGTLVLVYAFLDSIFTYYVHILMVTPVVLSSRYFNKRFTCRTALFTYAAFFVSAIYGAFHGVLDLNMLELPPGTILDLGSSKWIVDAVENMNYDRSLLMLNSLEVYRVKLLLSLAVAVASIMVAEQGRRMVYRQKELTERKVRVDEELALATKIQTDMLPSNFPAFPDRKEFDLYATMAPAKEVGGDFYDFFLVDDDHLCMVIADASGKGVPAAMYMVSSKSIIANNAMMGKSPAQILHDTNNVLCVNAQEEMFVTVWVGILEISTGKLTAANGGHEYPVLKQGDKFKLFMDTHGLVLGGISGINYKEYEIQLKPGDRLFVYTDGVPEAQRDEGELFGTDRMVNVLNEGRNLEPEKLLKSVREAVDTYVSGFDQFDDITMLCLDYKGK